MRLAPYVGSTIRIRHDMGETLLASQLDLPAAEPLRQSEPSRVAPAAFVPSKRLTRLGDERSVDRRSPIALAQLNDQVEELAPPSAEPGFEDDISLEGVPLDDFDEPAVGDTEPIVLEDLLAEEDDTLPAPSYGDDFEAIPAESYYDESPHSGEACPNCQAAGKPAPVCNCPQCRERHARYGCPTCGRRGGFGMFGPCCLGPEIRLKDTIAPRSPIDFGGWTQIGYHSNRARLSLSDNDAAAFNDHPDRLNLHQQWLWLEKKANGARGLDWGFRADLMYGTDAAKTQAFGNPPGEWDYLNGWDRGGGYGFANPQLYAELAAGDWSLIAGHFYTIAGYEVVTAPDNFFYSHSLTMFNSEPFTHTGLLATYSGAPNTEFYAGWTSGWDTAFDSVAGGSSFLGGFKSSWLKNVSLAYVTTLGNLGTRSVGEDAYTHSIVLDAAVSDRLTYVFQTDLVAYDDPTGQGGNDEIGINQYLFYTFDDCWAAGGRIEWWKSDGFSYQELTLGVNYRHTANLVFRPEIRYDWTGSDLAAQNVGYATSGDYSHVTFGVDAILTY